MGETADHADPLEGLEERLQNHSKAFESLLALTPAREYYGSHFVDGQDPSEQWNKKKQSKEQKRAAKKAKLDPKNNKSALDVLKEREAAALKRKRDEDGEGEGAEDEKEDGADEATPPKRQKSEEDADAAEARRRQKAERRKEKRAVKKEKMLAKQEKAARKKAQKQEHQQDRELDNAASERRPEVDDESDDDEDADVVPVEKHGDMDMFDASGLAELGDDNGYDQPAENASEMSSAPTTPVINSPAFDLGTNHSTASSSSSIVPPSKVDENDDSRDAKDEPAKSAEQSNPTAAKQLPSSTFKPNTEKLTDSEKLERLRKRIEELRAARKADGPDGRPAQSRQELLEQRRKKEEQRKAHKKELRRKAKEEEQRRQEERLRGSGSPLSTDIFSPRSPLPTENAYAFSRLAFEDGTSADPSLAELKDPKKRKGPQDARTALQAAQSKQARLAGYDAEKRSGIEEKDMWLNARKRAHGERVRDDTSLLKKALKRKEKQKSKSEQQWKERQEAVVKGKEMKQKKREANLRKRKEEKGVKGKKKVSGGKGGAKKGKKRAGFEGSFRA